MATITNKSLLSVEMEAEETELYQQILMKAVQEGQSQIPENPESKQIKPQPGFCVKTKTADDKLFINICKSDQIPSPPDISEEELIKILESDEPSSYRIPMSLGEPHAEIDNSGNGCTAYDVAISSEFYNKVKKNKLFMEFLMTIVLEGLENKYNVELSRDWKMLKNKKFFGSVSEQNIRTKSRPLIQEMDSTTISSSLSSRENENNAYTQKNLMSEIQRSAETPKYTIFAEPRDGNPSFLVAEISLPKVTSVRSLLLDLGEDRIVLWARPELYHLDIYIPYDILQEESGAQFNRSTKVLTVTMPVKPD